VLVLGGARSGKSACAERLLAAEPDVTYVATARPRPDDQEWTARVRAHVARRPTHWQTLETGDVAATLRSTRGAVRMDPARVLEHIEESRAEAAVEEAELGQA